MSSVPPSLFASALQGNLAQHQASAVRDAERNQRASADARQARAVDEKGSTVETADDASEVYSDSEGAGSQGRAFSTPDEEEAPALDANANDDGVEGRNIDLSA